MSVLHIECKTQEIFITRLNTNIDTNRFKIETPDYIYNPFFDTLLSNSIHNFYVFSPRRHPNCLLDVIPENGINDIRTSNKKRWFIQYVYPKPDSAGFSNGQFYYIVNDSVIIAKGSLKNNKLHGVMLVNFYEANQLGYVSDLIDCYLYNGSDLYFYKDGKQQKEQLTYRGGDWHYNPVELDFSFPKQKYQEENFNDTMTKTVRIKIPAIKKVK